MLIKYLKSVFNPKEIIVFFRKECTPFYKTYYEGIFMDLSFFDEQGFLTDLALSKGYIESSHNEGKVVTLHLTLWKENGIFNVRLYNFTHNKIHFFETFKELEEARIFFMAKTREHNLIRKMIRN